MDVRHLRHFVAVAEDLHFGRAAERLGMTQPPLSQSIQALEQELGARLFTRTHRSVELTPVGHFLLPQARRVVADVAELPALTRRFLQGEIGLLRLAFVSTADYGILPGLLRQYGGEFPGVRIELREATTDVQIESLLADEIDAGIVIAPPAATRHAALAYAPLQREPLLIAVPEEWVASGRVTISDQGVDLRALTEAPLLTFPRRVAPTLHDAITGCYTIRGLTPRFGQEAIQMQTIVSLVSAGLGLALVPASLRHLQRTDVVYAPLAGGSPEIETGLLWRHRNPQPTLRHLIRLARPLAATSSETSAPQTTRDR